MGLECSDCEVQYKAKDGKIFSTLEECKAHNALPRAYLVGSYGFRTVVFVDKEQAEEYQRNIRGILNTYIVEMPKNKVELPIDSHISFSGNWWQKIWN